MKIYTRIVIDLATGRVVEEQSYEYAGAVALAKGGGSPPPPPPPSEEERALQREQTELLRYQRKLLEKQLAQQNLLAPFLFEELGLKPVYGEDGAITGFEKLPPSEAEKLREEIDLALLERSQAALRGELPVSPTLEREIRDAEETLRERLRQQLGPGYETSTPGIEALSAYTQRAVEAREAARRGELTLSEQLSLARGGDLFNRSAADFSRTVAMPAMRPDFTNLVASFSDPLNRMAQERYRMAQERWRAWQAEQNRPSFGATLGQLIGIGLGSMAGGAGAAIGGSIGGAIGQSLDQ